MVSDLQSEIKKLSNLKNYKGKDVSFIERIAQLNLWKKQICIAKRFSKKEDKQLAEDFLDNYLSNYTFTDFNEIQNVADLVYEEILKHNIQVQIDKKVSDDSNSYIPEKLIQSLHDVEDRIWKLKDKSGITRDDKKDDLSALEELKKKFSTYIAFNRNEVTLYMPYTCRHCKKKDVQPILLRRRVKNFEILKHPAFSGRFLFNIEIINDVETGKISKDMAARYLRTSIAYIDWAIKNRHKIIDIEGVEAQAVTDYVTSTPHLGNIEDYNGK